MIARLMRIDDGHVRTYVVAVRGSCCSSMTACTWAPELKHLIVQQRIAITQLLHDGNHEQSTHIYAHAILGDAGLICTKV
jgi:hypothetical protein